MENEEKFSDDPEENLRIENEFLRIKLSALTGENFQPTKNTGELLAFENAFFKSCLDIEEHKRFGNIIMIKVYDQIGRPVYKPFGELALEEAEGEINRLTELLNKHKIRIDFVFEPFDDEIIYRFITEKVFMEEVDNFDHPAMSTTFTYENFIYKYSSSIREDTYEFFEGWETMNLEEYAYVMDNELINAAGQKMKWEEVFRKIKLFTDCYLKFNNCELNLENIQSEEQPDGSYLGFSEGSYNYEAVLESGETQFFEGSFKLYMRMNDESCTIYNFIIPGFVF